MDSKEINKNYIDNPLNIHSSKHLLCLILENIEHLKKSESNIETPEQKYISNSRQHTIPFIDFDLNYRFWLHTQSTDFGWGFTPQTQFCNATATSSSDEFEYTDTWGRFRIQQNYNNMCNKQVIFYSTPKEFVENVIMPSYLVSDYLEKNGYSILSMGQFNASTNSNAIPANELTSNSFATDIGTFDKGQGFYNIFQEPADKTGPTLIRCAVGGPYVGHAEGACADRKSCADEFYGDDTRRNGYG
jgi:hypothetical protein